MSGSEIFGVLVKNPAGFASKLATEQNAHPPKSSALMASKLQLPTVFCLSVAFGSVLMLAVAGCSSAESDPSDVAESPAEAESGNDRSEHDHGDVGQSGKTDMEKMDEALAGFSEEERQSALRQHFCPVSGEMLGSMGVPEKVDVEGKTVWICCDGCEDRLLADPDKYLAEL